MCYQWCNECWIISLVFYLLMSFAFKLISYFCFSLSCPWWFLQESSHASAVICTFKRWISHECQGGLLLLQLDFYCSFLPLPLFFYLHLSCWQGRRVDSIWVHGNTWVRYRVPQLLKVLLSPDTFLDWGETTFRELVQHFREEIYFLMTQLCTHNVLVE